MPSRLVALAWYRRHGAVIGYVVLCVAVGATIVGTRVNTLDIKREAKRGAEAHTAICAFRGDLVRRERQGEAFLRSHPHGAFGIPAVTIQQAISNEQRTIYALRGLRC